MPATRGEQRHSVVGADRHSHGGKDPGGQGTAQPAKHAVSARVFTSMGFNMSRVGFAGTSALGECRPLVWEGFVCVRVASRMCMRNKLAVNYVQSSFDVL